MTSQVKTAKLTMKTKSNFDQARLIIPITSKGISIKNMCLPASVAKISVTITHFTFYINSTGLVLIRSGFSS